VGTGGGPGGTSEPACTGQKKKGGQVELMDISGLLEIETATREGSTGLKVGPQMNRCQGVTPKVWAHWGGRTLAKAKTKNSWTGQLVRRKNYHPQ